MTTTEPDGAAVAPAPRRRRLRDLLLGETADVDYTSIPVSRAVFLLAIPMVVEMFMESLFAIVDIYWVNQLGKDATAAVTFTESMLSLVYAFAIGVSMSATAMVARRIGEKDPDAAARAGVQAIGLAVLVGILLGVPALIWAEDLLGLMGASPEVQAGGIGYTRAVLGGNIVVTLLFLNNAVLRGAGDARLAMYVLIVSNGINLVLDPLLIFGWGPVPALGVTGAGVATLCGRSIGVLLQFWLLWRGVGRVRIGRAQLALDLAAMVRLLRLSAGGVAQFLIATCSWVVLTAMLGSFDDTAVVAGQGTAVRVLIFFLMPAWGLSNAAATLVGQNLGAARPERAEHAVWVTGMWTAGALLVITLIMELWPEPLIGIFSEDPAVVHNAVLATRIMASGYVFYAWGMVMVQAFNGAGDTWTPTFLNLFCFWLFQLPLAWVLSQALDWGPAGVFWAVPIAESTFAVVAVLWFRRGTWRRAVA